jgi:hypothetical protein
VSEVSFEGIVSDGRLPLDMAKGIAKVIASSSGKRLEIIVKHKKKARSLNQNSYYWGVVIPMIVGMFRDNGNYVDGDDVHDFLKQHVGKLSRVLVLPDGEILKATGSTSKLTAMEFEAYLERVRAWAAEFDLAIPLPNENLTTMKGDL